MLMANIDATVDEVFQQWDDQKLKLQKVPLEGQEGKFGPWVKLIGQRQALFAERWRPDRMKVLKKLGNQNNATVESVRGVLTPVAREDFVADLRTFGVPDRYAAAAGSLVEVK
jgi:hypothetical protein